MDLINLLIHYTSLSNTIWLCHHEIVLKGGVLVSVNIQGN